MRATLYDDPREFLAVAGDALAADALVGTVIAGVGAREARQYDAGDPVSGRPHWYAVVHDDQGAVAGLAMRTFPSDPWTVYVLDMPEAAARALGEAVLDRGEPLTAVNGSLAAGRTVLEAGAAGRSVRVQVHLRLFRLGTLVPPRKVPGRLRPAAVEDLPLVSDWFGRFHHDADVQAGREPGTLHPADLDEAELRRRIQEQRVWLWCDPADRVVHLTGLSSAYGVTRIGPVFTPAEFRSHGYAGAAVAAVSARAQAPGDQVALFTDQANPTSNPLYLALGYEPVTDTAELVID